MFGKKKAVPQSFDLDRELGSAETDFESTLPVGSEANQGLNVSELFEDLPELLEPSAAEALPPQTRSKK